MAGRSLVVQNESRWTGNGVVLFLSAVQIAVANHELLAGTAEAGSASAMEDGGREQ